MIFMQPEVKRVLWIWLTQTGLFLIIRYVDVATPRKPHVIHAKAIRTCAVAMLPNQNQFASYFPKSSEKPLVTNRYLRKLYPQLTEQLNIQIKQAKLAKLQGFWPPRVKSVKEKNEVGWEIQAALWILGSSHYVVILKKSSSSIYEEMTDLILHCPNWKSWNDHRVAIE